MFECGTRWENSKARPKGRGAWSAGTCCEAVVAGATAAGSRVPYPHLSPHRPTVSSLIFACVGFISWSLHLSAESFRNWQHSKCGQGREQAASADRLEEEVP